MSANSDSNPSSTLSQLVQSSETYDSHLDLLKIVQQPDAVIHHQNAKEIPRAVLAQALNILLLGDLLQRVPVGKSYVEEKAAANEPLVFDHGALRTVAWENQQLPMGYLAFSRILEPLGFQLAGKYPLDAISMCGFVFCHQDLPFDIAQFFVSELYPQKFSAEFQAATDRVISASKDPLSPTADHLLQKLTAQQHLNFDESQTLLSVLLRCFDRQHEIPTLDDYKILRNESAEMAWIATEGNAFNHGTDRVRRLEAVDATQRELQRPMKAEIEIGVHANIRQTAYQATRVKREFRTDHGIQKIEVPGSFFEFIERGEVTLETGEKVMDLRFDSRNAQGIFTMTRSH